ncbi:uncharacterized protein LOC119976609 [Scyliorhinus canicula]|uniref:uncharacterized protein LOC119976609 n=1 Tax=Scyliorhinus canicula TaxID=7830 RepID=UPI0018F36385|nr:uncharacterized protein LOC119976609 [Scyliorhinus canicula]XP_038673162.1 uncharacterized protein LOC119976609 [Scyliorhinus canicula]XP_038673173.1 uncharacterized protein LOC119976609 [Scyliorhinus canicula]XP_038673180.1 uncharacterized protein LOC119976609 [Scyliorhinus canicula]XP_038673189.1 uncharacterized protein LOC119976609 [Scyliorhinus canicula]
MEGEESKSVIHVKNAFKAITKAPDVRKDTELLLKPYSNWEQFLMPGPLSVAILGEIIFVSAGEDFEIDKNVPIGGFKYMKYPKSFRASLVQVSNQGWEAFQEAHKNMDQIRLHSLTVPGDMKDAVTFIVQDNPEITKQNLSIPLENIKSSADKCLKLAEGVEKKFDLVIHLINELLEACTCSKGVYEEELRQIKITKEITEMKEKAAQEAKAEVEGYHKKMEEQMKKAQEDYKAAMDSVPVGWDAVGMGIVESISSGVKSFMTGGILTAMVSSITSSIPNGLNTVVKDSKSKNVGGSLNNIIFKSDLLQYFTSMLLSFLDKDGNIDMKKLRKEKDSSSMIKLCEENLKKLQQEAENGVDCEDKNAALDICKAGIEICEELEMLAKPQQVDAKTMENLAARIKNVQTKSIKFASHSKALTGSMGVTATPPHMAKAQSGEGVSGSEMATSNARFKVEQSAAQLRASQEMYEKSFENMKENNKELEEVLETLRKCEIQEIDFDITVKMLLKGLDALGRVKEQWGKMVLFFTMMSNLIGCCLGKSLNNFIKYGEKALETSSYSQNKFLQDLLYTQVSQATNIASLVHMISETYVQVSTQHLMDRVNGLGKLMGLDPNRDRDQFQAERKKFGADSDAASKAIEELVKKNKEDYEKHAQQRIDSINESARAFLPPATPEETKELQDIIAGSTQSAIMEISEEDKDQYA